jgi:hypothetical protein
MDMVYIYNRPDESILSIIWDRTLIDKSAMGCSPGISIGIMEGIRLWPTPLAAV